MTPACRYTYAREILSKKAIKVLSLINRSFSNTDAATIAIKNKLFNALVKPVLLYACEIWGPELLSYKTSFDKSTIEQNSPFFNIQQNEEINKKCKVKEPVTQQHIKNARLVKENPRGSISTELA